MRDVKIPQRWKCSFYLPLINVDCRLHGVELYFFEMSEFG